MIEREGRKDENREKKGEAQICSPLRPIGSGDLAGDKREGGRGEKNKEKEREEQIYFFPAGNQLRQLSRRRPDERVIIVGNDRIET